MLQKTRTLLGTVMLALATQAARADATAVTGTGATFPAKVYAQWAAQYAHDTGVAVDYLPSGSSVGVKQILARAVDFGASDVPMSPADLAKNQLFQFPTLVGGVVPVVNLPGIATASLRLDPALLAKIFAGRVARWNDRAISRLNPGLKLPDLRISRIVRADGSGTTEVFVQYLRQAAGSDIELRGGVAGWPGAVTAVQGSGKVAQAVKKTVGAIGYISSDHVLRERLVAVTLRNKQGQWVAPTLEAFSATIRAGGLFRNGLAAEPLLDLDGAGVWPIVTATYILVPRAPVSIERAGRTLNFFYRSFLLGDKAVAGTGFAPLPIATQAKIVRLLVDFRAQDGRPIPVLGEATPDLPAPPR